MIARREDEPNCGEMSISYYPYVDSLSPCLEFGRVLLDNAYLRPRSSTWIYEEGIAMAYTIFLSHNAADASIVREIWPACRST
jgi:hypothetical protein